MDDSSGNVVFATYRVKPGSEDAMLGLIRKHWPTLKGLGLVTSEPTVLYQRKDDTGGTVFVEIFTWIDAQAAGKAHHTPEVGAIWGPMAEHCESRGGKPMFEFPHHARVELG